MSRPRLLPCILLLAAGLAGCAAPAQRPATASYANPVIDSDFPDPAVLKASDGAFYVYATQGSANGRMSNIQVARSTNLVDWQILRDALPEKPGWASRTQDFWAPHVLEDRGTYYLYYSAKPDAALEDPSRGLCLAVATARRPEGPFSDSGRPLRCGPGFVNIDPMAFDDPATGKRLLYWGSGFEPIRVQELAPDRLSFAPGSAPVDLIEPDSTDDPANYERLIEGAWITLREGYYYLFYSGDNCCGPNAHYATMVARSRSATGPFETFEQATGAPNSVILAADESWIAPGHNSVVSDGAGVDWILYHAVDAHRPRGKETDEINTRRVMMLDRLQWSGGWPRIESGVPSSGTRSGPTLTDPFNRPR